MFATAVSTNARPGAAVPPTRAHKKLMASILSISNSKQYRIRVAAEDTESSAAARQDASDKTEPLPNGVEKIYVGKGNYIEDDPRKYPGRDNVYTGGFAGGETGLKNFVAEKGIPYSTPTKAEPPKVSSSTQKSGIYVGKGKYLDDDKSNTSQVMKLSARDSSLVGGFAGGEVGLKEFVATGEVPFGEGKKQQSPLIVAGIVSILGVTGGILFTDVGQFGEEIISGKTSVSPEVLSGLDENTKFLLEAGVLLTGVVASLIGGRALLGSFKKNLAEGVTKFGVLAVFWMVVFVAAQFVLDSN